MNNREKQESFYADAINCQYYNQTIHSICLSKYLHFRVKAHKAFSYQIPNSWYPQYLSIAYAHKMKPFIDFFNIKTLIITDIDYDSNGDLDKEITNETIKKLLNKKIAKDIIKDGSEEIEKNKLYLAYQKDETRSFEDSFWETNKDFINTNKDNFVSLKNTGNLAAYKNKYQFSNNFVIKKSNFAGDILYFSDETFSNWEIPEYIRKGLTWLIQ